MWPTPPRAPRSPSPPRAVRRRGTPRGWGCRTPRIETRPPPERGLSPAARAPSPPPPCTTPHFVHASSPSGPCACRAAVPSLCTITRHLSRAGQRRSPSRCSEPRLRIRRGRRTAPCACPSTSPHVSCLCNALAGVSVAGATGGRAARTPPPARASRRGVGRAPGPQARPYRSVAPNGTRAQRSSGSVGRQDGHGHLVTRKERPSYATPRANARSGASVARRDHLAYTGHVAG